MERQAQIAAFISPATKDLLERHSRTTGVKKGHLVEQALQHYLVALDQLPADVVVSPRLVVTRASGAAILKQLRTAKPTKALRDLMRNGD